MNKHVWLETNRYCPKWAGGRCIGFGERLTRASAEPPNRNHLFRDHVFEAIELDALDSDFHECTFINCYFWLNGRELSFSYCYLESCCFNTTSCIMRGDLVSMKSKYSGQEYAFAHCEIVKTALGNLLLNQATFEDCNLIDLTFEYPIAFRKVRYINSLGLESIKGLNSVRVMESEHVDILDDDFERARLRLMERHLSWERLRRYGQLPLFSASLGALIVIPAVLFLFALFNEQVNRWKNAIHTELKPSEDQLGYLASLIAHLHPLSLPALSFWLLISTFLLAIASTLFALLCPPRVKEFSFEQWTHELRQPAIHYLPLSWNRRWIRAVVAPCYFLGGVGTLIILVIKLWNAAIFVVQNSQFPWWAW